MAKAFPLHATLAEVAARYREHNDALERSQEGESVTAMMRRLDAENRAKQERKRGKR